VNKGDTRCKEEFGRDYNISETLPNLETIKAQQFASTSEKITVPGRTMTLELLMQNMTSGDTMIPLYMVLSAI